MDWFVTSKDRMGDEKENMKLNSLNADHATKDLTHGGAAPQLQQLDTIKRRRYRNKRKSVR